MARAFPGSGTSSSYLVATGARLGASGNTEWAVSFAAWVYPTAVHDGYIITEDKNGTAAGVCGLGCSSNGKFVAYVENTGGGSAAYTVDSYKLNCWTHIAVYIWSYQDFGFYINGHYVSLTKSTTSITFPSTTHVRIGCLRHYPSGGNTYYPFQGAACDVAMWKWVYGTDRLPDSTDYYLLARGQPVHEFCAGTGLRGYWPLRSRRSDIDNRVRNRTDQEWPRVAFVGDRATAMVAVNNPTWADDPPDLYRVRSRFHSVGSAVVNQTITPSVLSITAAASNVTLSPSALSYTAPVLTMTASNSAPTVTPGSLSVATTAVTATTAITAPTVTPGGFTLIPATLSETAAANAIDLVIAGQTLSGDVLTGTGAVTDLTLSIGTLGLTAETLTVTAAVQAPSLTPGAITLTGLVLNTTANGIDVTATIGSLALSSPVVAATATADTPTLTIGAISYTLDVLAISAAGVDTAIGVASQELSPAVLAATAAAVEPTLDLGAVTLVCETLFATTTVTPPNLVAGVVTLPPEVVSIMAEAISVQLASVVTISAGVCPAEAAVLPVTVVINSVLVAPTVELIANISDVTLDIGTLNFTAEILTAAAASTDLTLIGYTTINVQPVTIAAYVIGPIVVLSYVGIFADTAFMPPTGSMFE